MVTGIPRQELQDLYWVEELSERQIAAKLGVSRMPVQYWRAKHQIPCRERSEAVSISQVKPLLNPSDELAYVLGVLLGDGSVSIFQGGMYQRGNHYYRRRTCRISLSVVDYFFARSFFEALEKIDLHPSIGLRKHQGKQGFLYDVRANSKRFAEWYKGLSLDNIERIVTQDRDYSLSFVKGFYESEGTFHKHKRKEMVGFPRKSFEGHISMSNTKKEILELVVRVLGFLRVQSKLYGPYFHRGNFLAGIREKRWMNPGQEFRVVIYGESTERLMELWVDRSMETWKHGR